MRYFSIVGRCSQFISARLKEIEFKNILGFQVTDACIRVYTKPIDGKSKCYRLSLELEDEDIDINNIDPTKLTTK